MILKFDHLAFSCIKDKLNESITNFSDYESVFIEHNLPNLLIKEQLMQYKGATHDIALLNHKEKLSIEITAYDEVGDLVGKYDIKDNSIIVTTSSVKSSALFYEAIGFKHNSDNCYNIHPMLDDRDINIQFKENKMGSTNYLDSAGFCCMAFITNKANKEKKRLEKLNISTTDIMELTVNGKLLNVFFAYNEYGDMVEFICPEG